VSVVRLIVVTWEKIKEMPGSVVSGTPGRNNEVKSVVVSDGVNI